MNQEQLIAEFNRRYPGVDPSAVRDWASEATGGGKDLVPFTMVFDMIESFARDLETETGDDLTC